MKGRARRLTAGVGIALLGGSGLALALPALHAGADDRPETWNGLAEAQAVRISVQKPAALPTSDELAGLGIPFARSETTSSPSGRSIGSWLWPGETVADVKSLLAIAFDTGSSHQECERRKTDPDRQRNLRTPDVRDPITGEVIVPGGPVLDPTSGKPIKDPSDNPCGQETFLGFLGLVGRALPDYPFWSSARWPENKRGDADDTRSLCNPPANSTLLAAIGAPTNVCPPEVAPLGARFGWTQAHSDADRHHAEAVIAGFRPAAPLVRTGSVSTTSNVQWDGAALASSANVEINQLAFLMPDPADPGNPAKAKPFLEIDTLRSQTSSYSDGRAPSGVLSLEGVRVTLGTMTLEARIDRDGITVVDQRIPEELRKALTDALDRASVESGYSISAADASVGVAGAGTALETAGEPHAATVGGLILSMEVSDSLGGREVVSLAFGAASSRAVTQLGIPFVFPAPTFAPPPSFSPPSGGGTVTGGPVVIPPRRIAPAIVPPAAPRFFVAASKPTPAGVIVLAVAGMLLGAGTLVAAGIWETLF
jgi:hypothetical protein